MKKAWRPVLGESRSQAQESSGEFAVHLHELASFQSPECGSASCCSLQKSQSIFCENSLNRLLASLNETLILLSHELTALKLHLVLELMESFKQAINVGEGRVED